MHVLGLIPARGGSKGTPRKNVLPVLGRPVIAWTIEAAMTAKRLSSVYVSTDDPEIKQVSLVTGALVIDRPAEFATDTSAIDTALRHAVREVERSGPPVDILVWIQANVPTVRGLVIDQVVDQLIATGATCCQTVVPYRSPPQWAWQLDGDRMKPLAGVYSYTTRRQEMPEAYHPDGAAIAMRRDVLMNSEGQPPPAYLGNDRRAVVQRSYDGVEIETIDDLEFCAWTLARRQSRAG